MNAQPDQPTRCCARCWRIALVVLLTLLGAYAAYRYTLHRMVEAKLDEIRKQGYPVTLAELDKWYPQPPLGENAAQVFTEAFPHLTYANPEMSKLLRFVTMPGQRPHGDRLSEETRTAVTQLLATNEVAVELLHRAAAMNQCRFSTDLSKYPFESSRHLGKLRWGEQLLRLEAMQYAEDQNAESAVDSIICSLGIARFLTNEPVLLAELNRQSCNEISVASLENVLNLCSLRDSQLRKLAISSACAETTNALARALVAERCLGRYMFMTHRVYSRSMTRGEALVIHSTLALYDASGLLDIDQACYLDMIARYIHLAQGALPTREKEGAALRAQVESLSRYHFFSRGLSYLNSVLTKDTQQIGRLRNASAAISIERYRFANGKLPDHLDELVPVFLAAVPTDPFDGQPLRYKKLAKGYVVYSVGEDGKDDGGDEKKDITFTVER
jgi:hypothetical protein